MKKSLVKFKIYYTKSAYQDIQILDAVAKKKVKKKLELYSQKPFHYARKLFNSPLGEYRWRIGDYRVIFDIDDNKIIILRVGHRKEIYQ